MSWQDQIKKGNYTLALDFILGPSLDYIHDLAVILVEECERRGEIFTEEEKRDFVESCETSHLATLGDRLLTLVQSEMGEILFPKESE